MTPYTTKNDAIQYEIIEPPGEWANEHNIDAIADELITSTATGFHIDDTKDFWGVVANNAR